MEKLDFEEIRALWSSRAKSDTIDISKKDPYWDSFEKSILNSFLKKCQPTRVLDVGCGTGRLTKILEDQIDEVYACDYSEECVHATKRNTSKSHISVQDTQNLSYDDSFFSAVVAVRVLQSIPECEDKIKSVEELNRVLEPGGGLLLIEGNSERLTPHPRHNYYLSYEDWRDILRNVGFHLEETFSLPLSTVLAEIDKRNDWILRSTQKILYDVTYALDMILGRHEPGFVSHQFAMICSKREDGEIG